MVPDTEWIDKKHRLSCPSLGKIQTNTLLLSGFLYWCLFGRRCVCRSLDDLILSRETSLSLFFRPSCSSLPPAPRLNPSQPRDVLFFSEDPTSGAEYRACAGWVWRNTLVQMTSLFSSPPVSLHRLSPKEEFSFHSFGPGQVFEKVYYLKEIQADMGFSENGTIN